jgi:hypothetical protein
MNRIGIILFICTTALGSNLCYSQDRESCTNLFSFKGYIIREFSEHSRGRGIINIDRIERMILIPISDFENKIIEVYIPFKEQDSIFAFSPYQKAEFELKCTDSVLAMKIVSSAAQLKFDEPKKYKRAKNRSNKKYAIYFLEGTWIKLILDPSVSLLSSVFFIENILHNNVIDLYYLVSVVDFYELESLRLVRLKFPDL